MAWRRWFGVFQEGRALMEMGTSPSQGMATPPGDVLGSPGGRRRTVTSVGTRDAI